MTPRDRAVFVAAYTNLVIDVWSNPTSDRQLVEDPQSLVTRHKVPVPVGTQVVPIREVASADPDLDIQIAYWQESLTTGELKLVVPAVAQLEEAELDDAELDSVVAGLDTSCACCCPCCCT